jgi:hypothetical protein
MTWRLGFFATWLVLATATIVALVVVGDEVVPVDSPIALLERHSGVVLFRSPSLATWIEASDGQQFSRKTVVATLGGAMARLRFSDGRELELFADSQVELSLVESVGSDETLLNLLHGRFTLSRATRENRGSVWRGFSGGTGIEIRAGKALRRVDSGSENVLAAVKLEGEEGIDAVDSPGTDFQKRNEPGVSEVKAPAVKTSATPTARPVGTATPKATPKHPAKVAASPSAKPRGVRSPSESYDTSASRPERVIRVTVFERDGLGGIYSSGPQDFGWSDIRGIQLIEIPREKLERCVKGVEPEAMPVLFFSQIFEVAHVDLAIIVGSKGEEVLVLGRDAGGTIRVRRVVLTTTEIPDWLAGERKRMIEQER